MSYYVFSDLHGQYNLWQQIKSFLGENDKAFCLGDCIDRGPKGIDILLEILQDDRITLLKGNHENMLHHLYTEYIKDKDSVIYYDTLYYYISNGGNPTWNAFINLSEDKQYYIIQSIKDLPSKIDFINTYGQILLLSHAGTDPGTNDKYWRMRGVTHHYLWNRKHIATKEWTGKVNEYVIHGHTPTPLVNNTKDNIAVDFYCNNHKINLDLGSFATGKCALMNLDTFEITYFTSEVEI